MKIAKRFAYLALLLAIVLVVAGCQNVGVESGLISKEGVKAESLMPKDVFMVMKIGTDDVQQIDNLKVLAENFPTDGFDEAFEEMMNEIQDNLSETGMSVEDDLIPALGDTPQMMMSMVLADNPADDPEMLMVAVLGDADKVERFLKLSEEDGASVQPYKGFDIYSNEQKDSFLMRYKDVFLISNRLESIKEAVDRSGNAGSSLLANVAYQKGIKDLPSVIGYFYIDPASVMKQMENDPEAREIFDNLYGEDSEIKDLINIIEGELFAFTAEKDGVGIYGYVYGDAKMWKEHEYMNVNLDPAYLYKMLPGEGVMMYMESGQLRTSFELIEKMYANFDEFQDGMKMLKSGLKSVNIDFENDLMVFMDKGYSFSFYDSEGVIPSMLLAFDASGHTDAANKVMGVINGGFNSIVSETPEDLTGMLKNETVKDGENKGYKVSVDLSKLPEEQLADFPEDLGYDFALDYGVDENGLAYFAYYPDFVAGEYETLAENEEFKKDMEYIKGYDRSLMYFSMSNTMVYVDRMVEFGRKMSGEDISKPVPEYELAKIYIDPFKSFIMAAKTPKDGFAEMKGFIRIGK